MRKTRFSAPQESKPGVEPFPRDFRGFAEVEFLEAEEFAERFHPGVGDGAPLQVEF